MKINKFGISKTFKNSSKYSKQIEELYYNGYTIVDGKFDNEINYIKKIYKNIYKNQIEIFKGKKIIDPYVIKSPLIYDKVFEKIATNEILINIMNQMLGKNYILLMQNVNITKAKRKNNASSWHRDLNYQHWISSQPIAFNALFTIDDFSIENGCTCVLPSTHKFEEFPSDFYVKKNQKYLEASAGNIIILNAMLFHKAGVNKTKMDRVGINHVIGLPFLSQQINLPNSLGENRYKVNSFKYNYFGYKWSPAENSYNWRKKRI